MLEKELTEQEKVDRTVSVARDSVWVITTELQRKTENNGTLTDEGRGNIERNVAHLEIVLSNPKVVELGGDLSDLTAAIEAGRAALSE